MTTTTDDDVDDNDEPCSETPRTDVERLEWEPESFDARASLSRAPPSAAWLPSIEEDVLPAAPVYARVARDAEEPPDGADLDALADNFARAGGLAARAALHAAATGGWSESKADPDDR